MKAVADAVGSTSSKGKRVLRPKDRSNCLC